MAVVVVLSAFMDTVKIQNVSVISDMMVQIVPQSFHVVVMVNVTLLLAFVNVRLTGLVSTANSVCVCVLSGTSLPSLLLSVSTF
jgi:hypothetical protein